MMLRIGLKFIPYFLKFISRLKAFFKTIKKIIINNLMIDVVLIQRTLTDASIIQLNYFFF